MNMEEQMRLIGRNICYIRREKELTQRQMACILGVSVATLRKIERGEPTVRINSRLVCRICDTFELSADAFLRTDMAQDE